MKNGFKVIDADAHMQDELAHWLDFVEPTYRERSIKVKMVEDVFGGLGGRRQVEVLPCELFPKGQPRKASLQGSGPESRDGRIDLREYMPQKYNEAFHEEWSAQSRLQDMDRFGWDKQIGISGSTLGWDRLHDRDQDLLWAMARAYNNWCRQLLRRRPQASLSRRYPP